MHCPNSLRVTWMTGLSLLMKLVSEKVINPLKAGLSLLKCVSWPSPDLLLKATHDWNVIMNIFRANLGITFSSPATKLCITFPVVGGGGQNYTIKCRIELQIIFEHMVYSILIPWKNTADCSTWIYTLICRELKWFFLLII